MLLRKLGQALAATAGKLKEFLPQSIAMLGAIADTNQCFLCSSLPGRLR
jgi:hypothetical protein